MGEQVEAVILAGGRGTRLRPFTISIPKPLLPIGDMPIVEIVLRQLRHDGFRNVCFSLGHLAPFIQNFFGDGTALGLDLRYVVEDEPLGTAGALTLVPSLADDFIVQNGDTLTDLNYRDFLRFHREAGQPRRYSPTRSMNLSTTESWSSMPPGSFPPIWRSRPAITTSRPGSTCSTGPSSSLPSRGRASICLTC